MNTANFNFKRDGFVLASLVTKDFKLKYRRSVLGVVWSILNPLLMMIVLSAVFSFIFRAGIDNFPLYLILGTTLFNFMSAATNGGMMSILDSASLIKKIRINKMVFPLEKVIFELVNFVISLVAVVIVMLYFQVAPTWNILFLPLLLVYMIMFCTGLALILASLAVFFRDVIHLWGVIIMAWTYATPLFYPFDMLIDWMKVLMQFNPMYHFVTYFREIALYAQTPSLESNLLCFAMGAITLAVGIVVFNKSQKKFILYV
ncbi:ABC transporter permease [Raoultibacter phocaeensis]|uniref:ABC transporter permease n=1 Tax=Raoultibacter phocaeensis TaxID=2479841 RepID=UPI001117F58D|nr:ABC transporter permease [Raoultibacter phocaeensis]